MKQVIYLGDNSNLSFEMFRFLCTLPCKIACATIADRKLTTFPEHDLGLNFLASHKIPADVVGVKKWVNFHPAPLPEYRGRNVAYHAIMNEALTFGSTVHYMTAEYDTGDIIAQSYYSVRKHHTAGDLVRLSRQLLADMFKQYVPRLLAGEELPTSPQPPCKTYYPKTSLNEVIELTEIQQRWVRALTVHPKHNAYVTAGGLRYKLIPEVTRED